MASTPTETTRPDRTRWYAAAAIAAVAIGLVVAIPTLTDNAPPTSTVVAAQPLRLSLGAGDALSSCMVFDVATLAGMPVAFEGTVTSLEGEQVNLVVDRWFVGGDAPTVVLTAPAGQQALTGGIDFVQGSQYLITATQETVNYCGYSGPASTELRAFFEEAFAS